jgi:hypothetical protein
LEESGSMIKDMIPKPTRTIKVLLLGSYDTSTKQVMRDLVENLKATYDPECRGQFIAVLADDVDILWARSQLSTYLILTERKDSKCTIRLFRNQDTIDVFDCQEPELEDAVNQIKELIDKAGDYTEVAASLKVRCLCRWANLVSVIKQKGLTRGGELIELTMIVCLALFNVEDFTMKTVVFSRKGMKLSWMLQEMVNLGKVKTISFIDFKDLSEKLKAEIDVLIQREAIRSHASSD